MVYIKIDVQNNKILNKKKKSFWFRILLFFIPKANPDYEDKIDLVSSWLLEFESEESVPNREIGLVTNDIAIMKMPYEENYGYWSDNNMTLNDFKKSFDVNYISVDFFNKKWSNVV